MCRQAEFDLEEAFDLMDMVIQRNKTGYHYITDFAHLGDIGMVTGVIHVNEEIEIVVKYLHGVHQYKKAEYCCYFDSVKSEHQGFQTAFKSLSLELSAHECQSLWTCPVCSEKRKTMIARITPNILN